MNRLRWFLLVAVLPISINAFAGDIKMRGFASIVGGITSDADEVYEGYDNHFNVKPDSLFALQFDADLGDNLRATTQFISKGEDDYEATVEWAYLAYQFNDNFQLNAGKLRSPYYRFSDFIDVRYTYNWVTPPVEVYSIDFTSIDGLSLLHTASLGSVDSTVQFIYGQHDEVSNGASVDIEDFMGFNWQLTYDWLFLRTGYYQSNSTIVIPDFDPLTQAVDGVAAGFMTDLSYINEAITVSNDKGTFFSFAVGIDLINILFDAEIIQYEMEDSLIPLTDGYYISLGYRFDSFTPYIMHSNKTSDPEDNISSLVPAGIAAFPAIPTEAGTITLTQLLAGAVASTEADTDALEIGLRYDFHPSAAFKASYMQREDIFGEDISLFRTGIDLVF